MKDSERLSYLKSFKTEIEEELKRIQSRAHIESIEKEFKKNGYYKNRNKRIYFDSFGQVTPIEIQNYLKTKSERDVGVIQRNTDIVQPINTSICGHLCLFVLKALTSEHWTFQQVLNQLNNGYS